MDAFLLIKSNDISTVIIIPIKKERSEFISAVFGTKFNGIIIRIIETNVNKI